MSGGIHAIKGFSYQAQVILDHLFPFFEKYGSDASIRPEGIEDLDLYWHDNGCEQREYVQIKKPREDKAGNRKPKPWTLSDAFDKLLPNAINNLTGNQYRQTWVFGDEVSDELQCLVNAGNEAYAKLKQIYLPTLHRLALDRTIKECKIKEEIVKQINKFEVTQQITLEDVKSDFIKCLEGAVVSREFCKNYEDNLNEIHAVFPCILSRITIKSTYGLEKEVEQRILVKLKEKYNLSQKVIKNTLFRNLVGFIDEISKQPGRMFDQEEFEIEIHCVWPTMIPIRLPPCTEEYHILRPDLVEDIISSEAPNIIEVVGGSGSGKTMLAAEFLEKVSNQKEVFYIEVRDEVSFRDVISGIAFSLRRISRASAFGVAVDYQLSNNERFQKIARIFSELDKEILVVVDFVDGGCGLPFSNDLSLFIRSMTGGSFHLVMLSQESVLVNMSQFELNRYKIKSLNIRGLYFDEFAKLVSFYHKVVDYSILSAIYNRVTAGRSIGLYAQLAYSLASSQSLESMQKVSQMPSEEILPYIEQQRFAKLTQEAKTAAKRLVCLYLPFQREEIVSVFPNDNIGLAIRELAALGMLRTRPDDLYEMHETIRAGIEANIALAFRQETHYVLAEWYQARGNDSESIFHFDKAGSHDKAHQQAKETFLQGKQWEELYNYIIKNQLITKKELLETFRAQQKIDQIYLFSSILDQLQGEDVLEDLLKLLQNQPQRFADSYHDASACIQAIIRIDPEKLVELILYGIKHLSIADGKHAFIDAISTSIRSLPVTINSDILKIFDEQPIDIQERLLTLILLKPSRDSFSRLFNVIGNDCFKRMDKNDRHFQSWHLKINNKEELIEFLAAIPKEETSKMIIHKSPLLGVAEEIIWKERKFLKDACKAVLISDCPDETVKVNAIRVLVFLAEPSVFSLCEPFLEEKNNISEIAVILPVLLSGVSNPDLYRQQLLDPTVTINKRINALSMLMMTGENLSLTYQELKKAQDFEEHKKVWDFLFLVNFTKTPFSEGVPLIKAALESPADAKLKMLIAPMLLKLKDIASPEATQLLLMGISKNPPLPKVIECLNDHF